MNPARPAYEERGTSTNQRDGEPLRRFRGTRGWRPNGTVTAQLKNF
jgi:hypothetical protein